MNRKQFITELSLGLAGMYIGREILLANPAPKVTHHTVNLNRAFGQAIATLVEQAKEEAVIWIQNNEIIVNTYDGGETSFPFTTKSDMKTIFIAAQHKGSRMLNAIVSSMHMITPRESTWYRFATYGPDDHVQFNLYSPCIEDQSAQLFRQLKQVNAL